MVGTNPLMATNTLRYLPNKSFFAAAYQIDGAAKQVRKSTEFQNVVRKHDIDLHVTEPHHHNQSKVEGIIQEIQK